MIAFTQKQLGALVRITLVILSALCAQAFAGFISVDKTHSDDGNFTIHIDSSAWDEDASRNEVRTLRLYEFRADLASYGEPSYSDAAPVELPRGASAYPVSKVDSAIYKYVLQMCTSYSWSGGSTGGGGNTCTGVSDNSDNATFSASVEVRLTTDSGPAERLELSDYDLYYGDFNGDGIEGDIYFHGKDVFVLIAGDISIPLNIQGPPSFVITRLESSFGYHQPQLLNLNEEYLDDFVKASLSQDYFSGDMSGDGNDDYFIRGYQAGEPALIAIQTELGFPEILVPNIDIENRFDPSDRRNTIALQDYNLDGRMDLVLLSGPGGYVVDVVYSNTEGKADENYYTVSSINELFKVNTRSVNAVGKLGGQFRVNEAGAATYSIPVLTPQGTAGSTPSVSLNYSSQSGNGIVGQGWSLGAYSSITRCRQTKNIDGQAAAITWTESDRFCLDGQRLLLVSGSYGKAGSEYRTELDTQAVVQLKTDANTANSYFVVVRKDGSVSYYGNKPEEAVSSNANQAFAPNKTMTWAQSRTEDSIGNPIRYFYSHNSGSDFKVDRIDYAYGDSDKPNASIKFNYEARPDKLSGFSAGVNSTQTLRLASIDVNNTVNASANIRTYYIYYNRNVSDGSIRKRSLVARIQECVKNSCKVATRFDWNLVRGELPGANSPSSEITLGSEQSPLTDFKPADINGDGILDLAWLIKTNNGGFPEGPNYDTELHYAISIDGVLEPQFFRGETERKYLEFPENENSLVMLQALDYNADGRQDVAVYRSRDQKGWHVYLSVPVSGSGTSWLLDKESIFTGITDKDVVFADVNSDGLIDAIADEKIHLLEPAVENPSESDYKSNEFYAFSEAEDILLPGVTRYVAAPNQYQSSYTHIKESERIRYHGIGDFNGDGRMDALVGSYFTRSLVSTHPRQRYTKRQLTKERLYPVLSNGSEFPALAMISEREESGPIEDFELSQILVGDMNGDGLSDLIYRDGVEVWFYQSNGASFESKRIVVTLQDEDAAISLADYNNDGKQDIIATRHIGSSVHKDVYFWNTESDQLKRNLVRSFTGNDDTVGVFFDANGDGLTDFLSFHDRKLKIYYFQPESDVNEAIYSIDAGMGDVTTVSYESIQNSAHYSGLELKPEATSTGYECVYVGFRKPHRCFHYDVYSADDYYYALNKGIGSESQNKLRTAAPTLEINAPMYVVTQVEKPSPSVSLDNNIDAPSGNAGEPSTIVNAVAKVSYYYGEAKLQAGGRGFLGFHRLVSRDEQTGIETETVYRQDFPYIGSPVSTVVYAPDGGVLSETHNTYAIKQYLSSAASYSGSQKPTVQKSVQVGGSKTLGPITPYIKDSYEISYASKSGVEQPLSVLSALVASDYNNNTGQYLELYSDNNLIDCVSDATDCPEFTEAARKQVVLQQTVRTTEVDKYGNVTATTAYSRGGGVTQSITSQHKYLSGNSLSLGGMSLSYAQLGRLTRTDVTKVRNGVEEPGRAVNFQYYDEVSEVGHPGLLRYEFTSMHAPQHLASTKEYAYDQFGNIKTASVIAWAGPESGTVTRTSQTVYDETGRFVQESTDAENNKFELVSARNEYGSPTTVNGVNGVVTQHKYDVWGRETFTSSNIGTWMSKKYLSCPSSGIVCPSAAKFAVVQYDNNAGAGIPRAAAFYDLAGREIRTMSLGFDGTPIYVDKEHDIMGRVIRTSNPYFTTDATLAWTRTYYDILGRGLLVLEPSGAETSVYHSGYTTVTTNPLGFTKTEVKNGFGELVSVIDDAGTSISYSYTVDGLLSTTTGHADNEVEYKFGEISGLCKQPASNLQVVLCYDALGRKTQMWDPDKGLWTYSYNGFGELIQQINANGASSTIEYDLLGRTVKRTDYTPTQTIEGQTNWFYDGKAESDFPVNNATLQLTALIYKEGGIWAGIEEVPTYAEFVEFDTYGQPVATSVQMQDGLTYESRTDYDYNSGRVDKQHNPLGDYITLNGQRLESGTQNHYNEYGDLYKVTNLEDDKILYEIEKVNSRGQITKAKLADFITLDYVYSNTNGLLLEQGSTGGMTQQNITYVWDNVGNLKERINTSTSIASKNRWREDYCYDNINRLIKTNRVTKEAHASDLESYIPPACPQQDAEQDIEYDAFGNITRKAGVGKYNYGMGDVSSVNLGSDKPSPSRPGPHALSSTEEANGTVNYYYDASGNMLSDGTRSFVYTSYDMVSEITKGQHVTSFKYGPSRARYYRKDDKTNMAGAVISSQETWYLGSIEKVKLADGTIKWRRHLSGGVLHTYHTNADGSIINTGSPVEKRYMLKDHLGSTDMILDADGKIEQSMSFDAWGERRDPEGEQGYTSSQLTNFDHSITTKGFTGHEMLDEVGVVHMNGRIYDPRLGRFLQADPIIQAPTYTQSLNRYSYVFNNPLNATDPSGFVVQLIPATMIAAAAKAAAVIAFKAMVVKAMVYAAATAFLATWVQGASFGDAVAAGAIAGLSAAFSAGAGYGLAGAGLGWLTIPALGAIGGIAADIQGGNFGQGFAAAGLGAILGGVTQNLGKTARFVVGTVGAGVISRVTGGKFANGAATAAFWSLVRFRPVKTKYLPSGSSGRYDDPNGAEGQATFDEAVEFLRAEGRVKFVDRLEYEDVYVMSKDQGGDEHDPSKEVRLPAGDWNTAKTMFESGEYGFVNGVTSSDGKSVVLYRSSTHARSISWEDGSLGRVHGKYPTETDVYTNIEGAINTAAHELYHYRFDRFCTGVCFKHWKAQNSGDAAVERHRKAIKNGGEN